MKKKILLLFMIGLSIAFSDVTGVDRKKVITSHYSLKDSFTKSDTYNYQVQGRDFNFRVLEWNTSKDSAIRLFSSNDYTDNGKELIFKNINFAGLVLAELHLTYDGDKLVSWTGITKIDQSTMSELANTYRGKYKNSVIESTGENIEMFITKDRANSFFVILDPEMTTFYYQSPELYDKIIKGDTEEKEMQRIRIENEKIRKEKVKQDMKNDI